MTTKRNDPVVNRQLISLLDNLIQMGSWDKSLFLQATKKEIKDMRDKIANDLDLVIPEENPHHEDAIAQDVTKAPIPEGMLEVYVALYQANGLKIQNWENSFELLLARSSSRPIYNEETNAKDMLLRKGNPTNNAYIAILINKDDIIPVPEKHITDKFGHELLTVREDALKVENIRKFIHSSGTYILNKRHLVKQKTS